jgi:hypothetical protein
VLQEHDRLALELRDVQAPVCAEHGAFTTPDVGLDPAGTFLVGGWEHAVQRGRPFGDPWAFELERLEARAAQDPAWAVEPLATARRRLADEFHARGVDRRFAAATLLPVLARRALTENFELAPASVRRAKIGLMAAGTQLALGT